MKDMTKHVGVFFSV